LERDCKVSFLSTTNKLLSVFKCKFRI
jgi:hypothetical protein